MGPACSGPGSAELVARAQQLGWVLLLLALAVALIPLLLNQVREALGRSARLPLLLAAWHPGWWLGAHAADCGMVRLYASLAATLLAVTVVTIMVSRVVMVGARGGLR